MKSAESLTRYRAWNSINRLRSSKQTRKNPQKTWKNLSKNDFLAGFNVLIEELALYLMDFIKKC